MKYVCDAPPNTWFRIETEAEAIAEARAMNHAVDRHFRKARDAATATFQPPTTGRYIEQSIGRNDHVQRSMPMFVTLRDRDGKPLVTAMLPPGGKPAPGFRPIVVGPSNSDPYPEHEAAIAALAAHLAIELEHEVCFPYRRD